MKAIDLSADPDLIASWIEAQTSISRDDFEVALSRAGRVHGPFLLGLAWWGRKIETVTLTALVSGVWSEAEYPQRSLRLVDWRELFAAAGYTVDGQPAARPAEPVTLYRGAVHSRRRGWSWTADYETAQRFASGDLNGRQSGLVYVTSAPPLALLCGIHVASRSEDEYVVDTRGLKIAALAVSGPCAHAVPTGRKSGESREG